LIGFVSIPLKWPLLGHAGFLQYFDVTLHGADHIATLMPNSSFAGLRI
jgi:hypothetical protein